MITSLHSILGNKARPYLKKKEKEKEEEGGGGGEGEGGRRGKSPDLNLLFVLPTELSKHDDQHEEI